MINGEQSNPVIVAARLARHLQAAEQKIAQLEEMQMEYCALVNYLCRYYPDITDWQFTISKESMQRLKKEHGIRRVCATHNSAGDIVLTIADDKPSTPLIIP